MARGAPPGLAAPTAPPAAPALREAAALADAVRELDEDEGAAPERWAELVPRCRRVREALVAARAGGEEVAQLACEASAEACVRAGDLGEALKAVMSLVAEVFPARHAAGARGDVEARWAAARAAAVVYFAAVPAAAAPLEVQAEMRRAAPRGVREAALRHVLPVLAALSAGDYARLPRLADGSPRLLRLLLRRAALPAGRRRAARVWAKAYKQLARADALAMLSLEAGGDGQAALAEALRAHPAPAVAAPGGPEDPLPTTLAFK